MLARWRSKVGRTARLTSLLIRPKGPAPFGGYELSVELQNLADGDSVAAGSFGRLEFPERLVKMELAVPIDRMRFPSPARYEIAILFDGRELATQFVDTEGEDDDETR